MTPTQNRGHSNHAVASLSRTIAVFIAAAHTFITILVVSIAGVDTFIPAVFVFISVVFVFRLLAHTCCAAPPDDRERDACDQHAKYQDSHRYRQELARA